MPSKTWRSYPCDRVDHDVLRSFGQSVEDRLDEAADYIEHLENEIANKDDRIEELTDQVRELEREKFDLENQIENVISGEAARR